MSGAWLAALVLLTAYLTVAWKTTFVVEQPLLTILALLISTGTTSLLYARLLPPAGSIRSKDDDLPKHKQRAISTKGRTLLPGLHLDGDNHGSQRLLAALLLRCSFAIWAPQHPECSTWSMAPLLPIGVVIWMILTKQYDVSGLAKLNAFAASIFSFLAVTLHLPPRSTYICASSSPHVWLTPVLDHLGSLGDLTVLLCLCDLFRLAENKAANIRTLYRNVAVVCFYAAALLALSGSFTTTLAGHRQHFHKLDTFWLWSLFEMVPLITLTSWCFLKTNQHLGGLTASTLSTLAYALTYATFSVHSYNALAGLPSRASYAVLPVLAALIAFVAMARTALLPTIAVGRSSALLNMLQLGSLVLAVWHVKASISYEGSPAVDFYDSFIKGAASSQTFLDEQWHLSHNLTDAVTLYRKTHGRWPPPGYDAWYKYAVDRKSVTIDGYRTLHNNLMPFYALSPAELRNRTHDLIVNPWNDIVGVLIRDGQAHPGPHVNTNNRAFVEGLLRMINKFATHLPDMDLAFNTNDGGRVVLPYDIYNSLRSQGVGTFDDADVTNSYQPGRGTHWPRITGEVISNQVMQELGSQDNVYRYSTVGCPSTSPARQQNYWNVKESCTSCVLRDVGGFTPADWGDIFDVCYQPDLQRLHGAYSAPAKFKATHELYPVFSHSRLPGFNDLLYPSVWNYQDRVAYAPSKTLPDPDWKDKKDDLFWRGGTTEGVSYNDWKWQGMLRQRFAHLANNIKSAAPLAHILMPMTSVEEELIGTGKWEQVSVNILQPALKPDVVITPDITNCREMDCHVQRWEFAPTPNTTDFQEHWQHRYLLDLDGPSTSARLLPFLRSKSLPFKATIMQEWWQDRVRPWAHFVPLDVHGLSFWTTLAWFMGFEGIINGRQVTLPAHTEDAEQIATAGRELAERALRKEDMEVYMFRLLLEWARITDDWRDQIGFTGE